jgi:primosomal protein N' (replication factor Y) (superfamily II helicase)
VQGTDVPATENPVARVAVDVPLAHLDRPFDYLVPEAMSQTAVPGCRVRVRFAGRQVDGFVLDRRAASEHSGTLTPLTRVVSAESVLAPEVARLAGLVADRYAGTTADVLRLAVPPRHARAEREAAGGVPGQLAGQLGEQAPAAEAVDARATIGLGESGVGPAAETVRSRTSSPGGSGARGVGQAAGVGDSGAGATGAAGHSGADAAGAAGDSGAGAADAAGHSGADAAGAAGDSGAGAAGAAGHSGADAAGAVGESDVGLATRLAEWGHYANGPAFIAALTRGRSPRAVWAALPGPEHWAAAIAVAVEAALRSGRGALVVVPDKWDVAGLDSALARRLGSGRHVALTAQLGPAERYRRFLTVRRGQVKAVIGTRAAAFAPVADLGLVVCWDDGDDLHEEPRAPYPHAREVLMLRAHDVGAAALVGGIAVTAEGARLVSSGWAHPIRAGRKTTRAFAPRVVVGGEDSGAGADEGDAARAARLPTSAWLAAKNGLEHGPVLVQVPRGGYAPALACARCRTPARCAQCSGPLSITSGHAIATCGWCGALAGEWACPECGHRRFRARVVGAERTAEELGRAFPSAPVLSSNADRRRSAVPARPVLVVATPGAEPVAAGGYAAALLLDGWALLDRADLRAGEEALRRWLNAAALVRADGAVVVVAEPSARSVQALVRWDPSWHAERELADRTALGFPPASRMAAVEGTPDAVAELLGVVHLPLDAQVLGPIPVGDQRVRALVRTPLSGGGALATALKQGQGVRSARKATDPVRVDIDPHPLI